MHSCSKTYWNFYFIFFTTDLRLAKCGRHYQEIIVTFLHPYEWDLVLWYSAQNKATQQRFHEKTLRTPYLQAPALVVNPIRQPYRISSAPPYLNLPYYTPMKYHHFPQALLFVILNRYCIHRKKKSFIQKSKALLQRSFCFYFTHGFHRFIPFYSILPKYDSVSSPNIFPWCHICIPYFHSNMTWFPVHIYWG